MGKQRHIVYDTEIIGLSRPVFLLCTKCIETGERSSFWHHKKGDLSRFLKLLNDPLYTWVSFNGNWFDNPLLAAWINGHGVQVLKMIATRIIEERLPPWEAYRLAGIDGLKMDCIDLIEVAPGVMTSLKTYMGRMHYPSLVDLPFHHDQDLTPKECKILETYCMNDLGGTEALFKRLHTEIDLRIDLGKTYGLDLRSKSDAQAAEAILKKEARLGKASGLRPISICYRAPDIIQPKNKMLNDLLDKTEEEEFHLDIYGAPIEASWMSETIALHGGVYKYGLGGLHSQHDKNVFYEADDEWEISDIDAASYYPSIMLKCGIQPAMNGRGEQFMGVYGDIYHKRLEAKHLGMKKVAHSLKIAMNGTFGKLGSVFSSFYAPDLLLAVTLTGQLNLLCLIDELAKNKGIDVVSANTDGIMVRYKRALRDKVFKIVAANSKRTGFEYEETRYSKVAMKDVNNYIAIKLDGEVKAKGLYADTGLQKNPTAQICSLAAAEWLKNGTDPKRFIAKQRKLEPFLSIRNVKGGGVQHTRFDLVDDWENIERGLWQSASTGKQVKRVSRPAPFEVGTGGKPFGRVARWYMTTESLPAITYVSNGNKVPKTDGARLCMTLPDKMPADLDRNWYVNETYQILSDLGVAQFSNQV